MAAANVLILSSSPPRAFITYHLSSPPTASSPGNAPNMKPPDLRTRSRAAPIPENQYASFTTIANLLKAPSPNCLQAVEAIQPFRLASGDGSLDVLESAKPPQAKPKKAATKKDDEGGNKENKARRKTAVEKTEGGADGTEAKKPRKSRAKKAGEVDEVVGEGEVPKDPATKKSRAKKGTKSQNGGDPVKEKVVRKPKVKKTEGGAQTKILKGRVMKPLIDAKSSQGGEVSKQRKSELAVAISLDPFADSTGYGLVEAVKRRTNWTPPAASSKSNFTTPAHVPSEEGLSSCERSASNKRSKGFDDLFGNFGFTHTDVAGTEKKDIRWSGYQKTKAYRNGKDCYPVYKFKDEDLHSQPAPLLQYFSYQTIDGKVNDGFKVPAESRSKNPVKKPPTSLLSPESALKQVGNQDFVFGTSSQLAREESPTLLRDLQEAMQASNQIDDLDDPFADLIDEPSVQQPLKGQTKASSLNRTLWSAGARDFSGELLDVEMIDMVDSPVAVRPSKMITLRNSAGTLPETNDEWQDIDEAINSLPLDSIAGKAIPQNPELGKTTTVTELSSSPTTLASNTQPPKPQKPHKDLDAAPQPSQPISQTEASKDIRKPDFSSYTTAQLAKEVASYRFKPVKKRDEMIKLLERCWEGKIRIALGALGTNIKLSSPKKSTNATLPPSSQVDLESLKKPRGRPRKTSVLSTVISPAKSKATLLPLSSQVDSASPKRPRDRPRKNSAASTITSPAKLKAEAKRPKTTDTLEFVELDSDTPLSQTRTPKKKRLQKESRGIVEEISDSEVELTSSPPRRRVSQIGKLPPPLKMSRNDSEEITPASSQESLFTHITRAIQSATPTKNPSKPSWQEKILLYDPIILEDLTTWLNAGALDKVGWDAEVVPKEVKKWCETSWTPCIVTPHGQATRLSLPFKNTTHLKILLPFPLPFLPQNPQSNMAELLGVVASGMGVISLAIQLADSIKTLKELFSSMKAAPQEIFLAIEEVETLSLILEDINRSMREEIFLDPRTKVLAARSWRLCFASAEALRGLVGELEKSLGVGKDGKGGSVKGRFKVAVKREVMEGFRRRVEGAKMSLLLAGQCIGMAVQRQNWLGLESDMGEVRALVSRLSRVEAQMPSVEVEGKGENGVVESVEGVEETEGEVVTSSEMPPPSRKYSKRKRGYLQSQNGMSLFGVVQVVRSTHDDGTVQLKRSIQGWDQSLRVYKTVADDAPVIRYCINGDMKGLQTLFDSGLASPFEMDSGGWTPLHYAAAYARPNACRFLVENGADVNARTSWIFNPGGRSTPLHLLAEASRELKRSAYEGEAVPGDFLQTFDILCSSKMSDPFSTDQLGATVFYAYDGPLEGFKRLKQNEILQFEDMLWEDRVNLLSRQTMCQSWSSSTVEAWIQEIAPGGRITEEIAQHYFGNKETIYRAGNGSDFMSIILTTWTYYLRQEVKSHNTDVTFTANSRSCENIIVELVKNGATLWTIERLASRGTLFWPWTLKTLRNTNEFEMKEGATT
ncbi:hypothetical protein G7Y89_g13524 [Cudoniella acicularis]|uniref:Structure-specific endonuclease subunit SLX4 n=1 Tax=Cudoniella acicularis TaxID=354080 RepID=A0A8H4R8D4_9HELO|nr:hypothetical protein G7Y89_g13524 [Cudoniella acicularis]